MTDYTELLLQVSEVMRKHNRVGYRSVDSIAPTIMSDEEAVKAIREIVTPKGKWRKRNGYVYDCVCSCCKYIIYDGKTNFCPNCGADMRGEE